MTIFAVGFFSGLKNRIGYRFSGLFQSPPSLFRGGQAVLEKSGVPVSMISTYLCIMMTKILFGLCVFGPHLFALGVFVPGVVGPYLSGPGVFGPDVFGPCLFGSGVVGPCLFGPCLFGPDVFGPHVFGPGVFGPKDTMGMVAFTPGGLD